MRYIAPPMLVVRLLAGVWLLATSALLGQQSPPAGQFPIYVDTEVSRAYVKVGKTGLGHEHGAAGRLRRGFLRLGAATEAGVLEFDMASFVADTKEARQAVGLAGETDAATARQVNDNMRGPQVLDVEHHPTATFVVKSALPPKGQPSGQRVQYTLEGDFTLHGVSRPMQLTAEAQVTDRGWRVQTRFAILQTAFGITPYTRAFGAVGVADRLEIIGDVLLVATPPQAQTQKNTPAR
jgi:polyisoprenoid-binding protein YceI